MDDNMSHALLMSAAILIFIIALTVSFNLISQTRETSDYVLYSYDDTKYFDQGYENIKYTLAKETENYRIVTIEEIMPTAYRYIKEHYGVTIVDKNGEIQARFDEATESIANNWPSYVKNSNPICTKHTDYINDLIKASGFSSANVNLQEMFEKVYFLNKSSGNTSIHYGTPWLGNESRVVKRMDVDFGGGTASYTSGSHPGLDLLSRYAKTKFKEVFLYVSDDSGIEKDDITGDSVILRSTTTKLEIIYVIVD